MGRKPGNKAHRNQLRARLARLGVEGRQLIEQVVAELARSGYRPREAWRLAHELTQEEVAARFNQVRGESGSGARGSRICEYEKWPIGGSRPSMRALKILAAVYETTWDRLVDIDDLEAMPAHDRRELLDISGRGYSDSPDLLVPRQRRRRVSAAHSDAALQFGPPIAGWRSAIVREPLTIAAAGPASARSGGGLPGEITHFTGRDGPMAELRARITEQTPQGTVVTIYAFDGMAGVGKTAFARHAAQEFAERYPDGAIWVDLYGHTPGMQAREPSAALEQLLLQVGVPPEAIKPNLAERQDQWRYHIYARRKLIVLDNALTSDQVLPLLPEAPGYLVLITSRRKLTGLTDAYPLRSMCWGGMRRSGYSSNWSASSDVRTVTRFARSWPPVVGCPWRSGLSPGGYVITVTNCSPTSLRTSPTRARRWTPSSPTISRCGRHLSGPTDC
jgi:transcriptional regulator with XRE-family HTH domain